MENDRIVYLDALVTWMRKRAVAQCEGVTLAQLAEPGTVEKADLSDDQRRALAALSRRFREECFYPGTPDKDKS